MQEEELMPFRLIFLGTSSGMPSKSRGLPAVLLEWESDLILFDCGEGTQLKLLNFKVGLGRPLKILVSHMHGDHVLGLPGLLQTLALLDRRRPVEVYGPRSLEKFLSCLKETVGLNLSFPLRYYEVEDRREYDFGVYKIVSRRVSHGVEAYGYRFQEKDRPGVFHPEKARALGVPEGPLWKKIQLGEPVRLGDGRIVKPNQILGPPRPGFKLAYTGDTAPCRSVEEIASGVDVLIHESTFDEELAEKATLEKHSTAAQAAAVALKSKVKLLVLTHISARYPDSQPLWEEARRIFPNVVVAEDGLTIEFRRTDTGYEYKLEKLGF